jgi:hypothetical protein
MTLQGASPRHYGAPVAIALYYQGSDMPVIQMNRMRPRPRKGGMVGARGRPLKKKLVAEM